MISVLEQNSDRISFFPVVETEGMTVKVKAGSFTFPAGDPVFHEDSEDELGGHFTYPSKQVILTEDQEIDTSGVTEETVFYGYLCEDANGQAVVVVDEHVVGGPPIVWAGSSLTMLYRVFSVVVKPTTTTLDDVMVRVLHVRQSNG